MYFANPYPNGSDSSENEDQINKEAMSLVIYMTQALSYYLGSWGSKH